MRERRSHQRIRFDGQITIFKQCGESAIVTCENLSIGGIAIKSKIPFYFNEQIAITLPIFNPKTKATETIDLICCVTHIIELTYPAGHIRVGLEFYKPEKKKVKLIAKYIDHMFEQNFQSAG